MQKGICISMSLYHSCVKRSYSNIILNLYRLEVGKRKTPECKPRVFLTMKTVAEEIHQIEEGKKKMCLKFITIDNLIQILYQ